jgi:hypothetical protein
MLRTTRLHRLARLSSAFALLLCSIPALGQSPAPRIRGPIELTPSVPLEGSLNPHVRLSDDLGLLAPDTLIRGITLVFKRTPAQEADLQQLLAQQTDPTSPLYHHWLTPEDFASRFGVADADITATESWLQSHGFTIDSLARSHDRVTFSGTAVEVQQAFGAELHRLRFPEDSGTELHFAAATELSLPPALAPLTAAVLHLSDFRPKPSVRAIRPDYTTAGNQSHFLAPKDIASMYDLGPLISTNDTGFGQSLAIIGQSFVKTGSGSSISNFVFDVATAYPGITPVILPNSGNEAILPGDVGESEIDLEYSSVLASSANIFFVYTGSNSNYNAFDALQYAIDEDIAPVISISYGGCEPLMSTTDMQQASSVFEQAAAQGQTIVASAGDSGSTGCASFSSSDGVSTTQQQELAVSFPASSPYVTAVGGTQMAPGTFAAGTSNYWDPPPGNGLDAVNSLISYVPEVVWNEDSTTYGIVASGGGISSVFTRPSWQTGVPGIPSGGYRLVPDIALQASVSSPGYVICTDDPDIVGSLTDCSSGLKASNGSYVLTGGTSFGAPIFASFLVGLNQYLMSSGLGNINPALYSLAAQPATYNSVFHDITSGTTACAIGDGNCGTPGTTGYAATTGYDMATGLGSVDFGKLATNWPFTPPPTGVFPTYMSINNAPQTATAGATIPVTVNLTAIFSCFCTPPAPSGNLTVLVDGALSTPVPLQAANPGATATLNFVAPSATGSHVVVVRYPGDAFHLPSYSTFAVLVGNVTPSGSFTLSANNLTLATNGSGSTQITITPSGGYSGALTWTSTYTGGTVAQTFCYLVQSASINGPTTATMSMGEGTACSSSPTGSRAPSPLQGPAQRSSLEPPSKPASRAPVAATFVALLFCGLLPSRRRRFLPILCATMLAIIATTLTGCGGGSNASGSGGGSSTNPQPQVYTITLKATDSVNTTITASTSFTLTVN